MNITFGLSASLKDNSKQFVCVARIVSSGTIAETQIPTKESTPPYYVNPFQVVFTLLIPGVAYKFEMWESSDNTPTGLLRTYYYFTGQTTIINLRTDLQITVGTTAGVTDGSDTYTDASLIGWNFRLVKVGQGPLFYLTYWDRPTQDVIHQLQGLVFNDKEEYNVEFYPQVTTYNTPISGLPTVLQVITANQTLTADDTNKYNCLQGASTYFEVLLPSGSTVIPFQPIYIKSSGGIHKNVAIICQGSDSIQRAKITTYLVLGQNEDCVIFWDGTVFRVQGDLFALDNVGQITFSYSKIEPKSVFGNGVLVSRKDLRRLWEQALADGLVVSDTQWSSSVTDANGKVTYPYKSFYSSGDGTTTFRLPLLYNGGFLKAASTGAGAFTNWCMPSFRVGTNIGQGGTPNGELPAAGPRSDYSNLHSGAIDMSTKPVRTDGSAFINQAEDTLNPVYSNVYASIRF